MAREWCLNMPDLIYDLAGFFIYFPPKNPHDPDDQSLPYVKCPICAKSLYLLTDEKITRRIIERHIAIHIEKRHLKT